jgi:hypothetical protein
MYVAVGWDLLLTTALVILSPDGPRSPLMVLYFVIIATAPLRLSLPLVYFATLGAMAAAAVVLGQYIFFRVGRDAYFGAKPGTGPRLPVVSELIFLLALGAAGLLAGQVVRQARRLVQGYPVRVEDDKEAA